MLFVASLMTTLGAAYLYEKFAKSCAEIAIACVPVAIGGLLVTLVLAPWQFKLLSLIAVYLIFAPDKQSRS